MIPVSKIYAFAILVMLMSAQSASSQTCGFGCLGLGGFYAGYNYQQYQADPLNQEYLMDFGNAKGFRLGANLFRTKYKNFLFSFKGYYQFLNDEQSRLINTDENPYTFTQSLDLNYWGVGFDSGVFLFGFMDLKIIDAQITFHNAKLTFSTTRAEDTQDEVFRNPKTKVGLQLGSGLIFHLAGDYISLETTAGYSFFSIGPIEDENGNQLLDYGVGEEAVPFDKIVEKGGLNLVMQLNIGIPIY